MPSYGIVPALSSLRGAVGYFEHGIFGDRQAEQQGHAAQAAEEETQSLLQVGAVSAVKSPATTDVWRL